MNRSACLLAALLALSVPAAAGQAIFQATGTVAGGSASSGPFAGTPVGAAVHMIFEVNTPGTPVSPGYENYAIDMPTFVLTIGANSTGMSGPANVGMQNAFPVSDGVRLFSAPLAGGGNFAFEFGAPATLFTSTDPLMNVGSWSGFFYTSFNFAVQGPSVFLDLNLLTFSISLPTTGTPVCFGDGSGTACPCGNNSPAGSMVGCLSSFAMGGRLLATGAASVGADTLLLQANQLPNGPGLYFQGTSIAGTGIAFGDGLLCATGVITRLGVVFASGNASTYPSGAMPVPISVGGSCSPSDIRQYQLWYRDGDPTFCTPSTFNLTNALTITWGS
ncbi:MAG: hypothetical protein JNL28_01005 [Planctomycetes bacterium]|nr:hypothetical protein [Planctomycetota bacterium]